MTVVSNSADDTFAIGKKLGGSFRGGEIVRLYGDLGAGKTVIAKGIAAALGVTEAVVSPTFNLMNEYDGTALKLYHYDCYRLKSGREAQEAGLCEFFADKGAVCVIEWSENISDALTSYDCIEVRIQIKDQDTRILEIAD